MPDNHSRTLQKHFKDYRLTPQRRLVLELFWEHKDKHLSAEEVHRLLQDKEKQVGLATVYRTLDLLVELGLLHKHHFGDGRSRYESVQKTTEHHHHHLLCMNCQEILEVKEDLLHHLEKRIAEEHDFKVIDHQLQFFGYCSRCRGILKTKEQDS